MRSFNKLFVIIFAAAAVMFFLMNFVISSSLGSTYEKEYLVEIGRLSVQIKNTGSCDISECRYVTAASEVTESAVLEGAGSYAVREINGRLYRFDYTLPENTLPIFLVANIALAAAVLFSLLLTLYIKTNIIKPFSKLSDTPYEISKGNLSAPLKESRSRYFGKFVWGMNMLRESTEQHKQNELALQKDKQTLILSVSHDIKTPLSSIKLYSKALSKGLYDSREKQIEAAKSIEHSADEIESFVSELIQSANEDFLLLDVDNGEFYQSQVINRINELYSDKLSLLKISFNIGEFSDCLLKGDADRAEEVLQNLMENAIKYGDGGSIELSFSEEEDCRLVTVINSGCTLSENELPHIFDSFWRGSNVKNNQGSGLGLYICRRLMQKMDGDIFAKISDGRMFVSAVFRKP